MKRIYDSYVNQIKKAINLRHDTRVFSMAEGREIDSYSPDLIKGLSADSRALEPKTGMHTLAELLGISPVLKPYKGDHPDFAHLRNTGGSEYHYIVSMFIDVQGSTRFHKKYDLEQIALIIQTIVAAATHTIALFGGHVQRLQYDGVFCYFGGKSVKKETAVKAAIDAASFFSYFIRYELREVFEIEGIDNVYTRVGIDFGDDKEVQWVIFGTEGCDELTTNSLHTSLAPKMQAKAKANGIMIGKNVWSRLGKMQLFTDFLRDDKNNVDEIERYIYKDEGKNFYYSQHQFDWHAYLKSSYPFVVADQKGHLTIDYSAHPNKTAIEQQSLNRLYEKSVALTAGTASINRQGQIQAQGGGTPVPANRFYYDSKEGHENI